MTDAEKTAWALLLQARIPPSLYRYMGSVDSFLKGRKAGLLFQFENVRTRQRIFLLQDSPKDAAA